MKETKVSLANVKDIVTILAAIGVPIAAAWAAVLAFWKSTATQQTSVHVLLVLSASSISVGIALALWIFRQRGKIRELKTSLDSLKRPHRFQDDCTLDEKTGMYRHKIKPGFFCVACAAKDDRESPMIESSTKDWGWDCRVSSSHFVRGPAWHPPTPVQSRDRWKIY